MNWNHVRSNMKRLTNAASGEPDGVSPRTSGIKRPGADATRLTKFDSLPTSRSRNRRQTARCQFEHPRAGSVLLIVLVVVAMLVLITEFASNVAAASAIMPVVAALVAALGADPILLALPAAFASSWGFMLPSGTGPNAIAWGTGHIAMPRVLRAGLMLDIAGVFLIVGVVWTIAALV